MSCNIAMSLIPKLFDVNNNEDILGSNAICAPNALPISCPSLNLAWNNGFQGLVINGLFLISASPEKEKARKHSLF